MRSRLVKGMIAVALLACFVLPMAATAAEAWVNCNLVRLGMANGQIKIQVTAGNGSFTNKWVLLDPAMSTKDMDRTMAVLLTALSTGTTIDIKIDAALALPKCSKLFYNS